MLGCENGKGKLLGVIVGILLGCDEGEIDGDKLLQAFLLQTKYI